MSTTLRLDTDCDLCGYGGRIAEPADFVRYGSEQHPVDLCWQCARPGVPIGARLSCGRHEVAIAAAGWTCSCGETFEDTGRLGVEGWPYVVPTRVREAVPDLVAATARRHIQEP